MLTIQLHNLLFHSFHGMYKEEKILGNDFEVNVAVTFDAKNEIHTIYETVDYVSLHGIIKKLMDKPSPLIETVVQQMADEIKLYDKKCGIASALFLFYPSGLQPIIFNYSFTYLRLFKVSLHGKNRHSKKIKQSSLVF